MKKTSKKENAKLTPEVTANKVNFTSSIKDSLFNLKKLPLEERKKLCIENCLECSYCPHSESTIGFCELGLQKVGSKIDSYAGTQKANAMMGRCSICNVSVCIPYFLYCT